MQECDVYVVDEAIEPRVVQAINALAHAGRGLGRPLVDTLRRSSIANLRETQVSAVRGRWTAWYGEAIPLSEQRYEIYLTERASEVSCNS